MSAIDARAATTTWLERLGIADRADSKVEALSHGNQQRVQLAAALVHGPELLVLDEPLAGLDPAGIDAIGEVLAEQARSGCCVLFSSHQLDQVEDLCESVTIIDHGRLVVTGKVDELAAQRPAPTGGAGGRGPGCLVGTRHRRRHDLRDRRRRGTTRARRLGGQRVGAPGRHGSGPGHRVRLRAPPTVRGVPGGVGVRGAVIAAIVAVILVVRLRAPSADAERPASSGRPAQGWGRFKSDVGLVARPGDARAVPGQDLPRRDPAHPGSGRGCHRHPHARQGKATTPTRSALSGRCSAPLRAAVVASAKSVGDHGSLRARTRREGAPSRLCAPGTSTSPSSRVGSSS